MNIIQMQLKKKKKWNLLYVSNSAQLSYRIYNFTLLSHCGTIKCRWRCVSQSVTTERSNFSLSEKPFLVLAFQTVCCNRNVECIFCFTFFLFWLTMASDKKWLPLESNPDVSHYVFIYFLIEMIGFVKYRLFIGYLEFSFVSV